MDCLSAPYSPQIPNQRTIGVEEEFLLVDETSFSPAPACLKILAHLPQSQGASVPSLGSELQQEQLETATPVCTSLDELAAAVELGRLLADTAAKAVGARAVALATSLEPVSPHVVPSRRYLAMGDRFGVTLREQLTCGFHIHVGVESAEEGVAVLDRIRPWLPVLLALSANSPFANGTDTGYESYRHQAWIRWPTAGPYDLFGSARNYRNLVDSLLGQQVLLDEGMVYFDARLSSRYPTVEIRIADVCLDSGHAVAIAGLARALVQTAAREWRLGRKPAHVSTLQLQLANWCASKYGIESDLIHPATLTTSPAVDVVGALLDHVDTALRESGDHSLVVREVSCILTSGTGSRRQRQVMSVAHSLSAVVEDALLQTHASSGPIARGGVDAQRPAALDLRPI